ncbi:MAG: hypothetical protein U1F76_16595 [Candidatus Competibacteraceae bacterium]
MNFPGFNAEHALGKPSKPYRSYAQFGEITSGYGTALVIPAQVDIDNSAEFEEGAEYSEDDAGYAEAEAFSGEDMGVDETELGDEAENGLEDMDETELGDEAENGLEDTDETELEYGDAS